MYVSGKESAAAKFCKENQIAVEQVKSWGDCRHVIGKSRYRVEYAFSNLSQGEREILLAMAELDINDLVSTTFSGENYTTTPKTDNAKIAKAFRKVRLISGMFPKGINRT